MMIESFNARVWRDFVPRFNLLFFIMWIRCEPFWELNFELILMTAKLNSRARTNCPVPGFHNGEYYA